MQRIITVIVFAVVFASCTHKSENDLVIYKSIQASLIHSSDAIAQSNKEIYLAIEGRTKDIKTAGEAQKWQPKALMAKDISDNTVKYIHSLISELKKEAGLALINGLETFEEDNRDVVNRMFVTNNKGKELQTRLLQFKKDILAVDSELYNQFEHVIIDVSDSGLKKSFTNSYFQNISAIAAVTMLDKYESEVVNSENKILRFFLNKAAGFGGCGFGERVFPIVSLKSTYLKAGDDIEVTAGLGSFYTAAEPQITINGKVFQTRSIDGIVQYKFKAPLKPGKYTFPVKTEFTAEDMKRQVLTQNIAYTVIE